jgi:hypothetical protein
MVDKSVVKILVFSFIFANAMLLDSFIALNIVDWASNLVISTFSF